MPFAIGILTLSALIIAVLHLGELENFVTLAKTAQAKWLIAAAVAQIATYACAASVWYLTLRSAGCQITYWNLIPLSIAKLFTDQAVPTGGISGAMLVISGLLRRQVPTADAMAVMLVSLVSYYAAYLLAVMASVGLLWLHGYRQPGFLVAAFALALIAIGLPVLILGTRRWQPKPLRKAVAYFPALEELMTASKTAPSGLLLQASVLGRAVALQLAVFGLDALSFWIVFLALGQPIAPWIAFVAVLAASVAATLTPIPLGLGTFEAGAVAMLTLVKVPPETALAATLLLRGMTFWLPMVPGLWLARREVKDAAPPGHLLSARPESAGQSENART